MDERLKRSAALLIPRDGLAWNTLARLYHFRDTSRSVGKFVYRRIFRDSIFYDDSELEMCSLDHSLTLQKVLDYYKPTSVLDVGCGVGQSLDWFVEREVDAVGLEGSALAISKARHPDRIRQVNLNQAVNLHRTFDLVWCFEVIEHIHPRFEPALLKTLTSHGDHLVISAARPGQGGEGHFNEQHPEYWIDRSPNLVLATTKI